MKVFIFLLFKRDKSLETTNWQLLTIHLFNVLKHTKITKHFEVKIFS